MGDDRPVVLMRRKAGYGPWSVFPVVPDGERGRTLGALHHGTREECAAFAASMRVIGEVVEPLDRGDLFDFECRLGRMLRGAKQSTKAGDQ